MKPVLASLALLALAAPTAAAASLELTVENVETADGTLMIAVFDSETGWKKSEAAKGLRADPATGTVTVTIDGLTPGEIGIKLYHDVDGDGELDTGSFMMPTEPYGFSNDAPVRFGPPSWKNAHFTLSETATKHTIKLR